MFSLKKWLILPLSALCSFSLFAQEGTEVTNAFLDLQRKGDFTVQLSEMQTPASPVQLQRLLAEKPVCNYFVFTEDRAFDICMDREIPERWTNRTTDDRLQFKGKALPGEYYTFQLGLFTPYQSLEGVELIFQDLKNERKQIVSKELFTCFNQTGTDIYGKPFNNKIAVDQQCVQPLWCGIEIPESASGTYTGKLIVKPANAPAQQIQLTLDISGNPVADHGDDEGWRKGRLRWLNSEAGLEDSPTAPYVPLQFENGCISYLGGTFQVGEDGLPEQIITRYTESNTLDSSVSNPVLQRKMNFVIETETGEEQLKVKKKRLLNQSSTLVHWEYLLGNKDFDLIVEGQFSFDGFCQYSCRVTSRTGKKVKDIRLEVPYTPAASQYLMGLGEKGGFRKSDPIHWKWNTDKHQDKIWVGGVNAGLNLVFMDEDYKRPLVNVYYALGKLNLPSSWGNANKGGITIGENNDEVLLEAYSGDRSLERKQTLHYNFNMLITPVKPLNLTQQATARFYHSNSDMSDAYIPAALEAGATAVNVHHKKDIYPFINYPYYDESLADLKAFSDKAHANNLQMRLYYTTRELTVKIPELWALRSLKGEIIHDGPGKDARTLIHPNGPHKWLSDNLQTNFIPAWYNAFSEGKYKGDMDLSIITTPDSRWNNYYLEGLRWMVNHIGLDGVYIDDSALDRKTLQRARRILDADGKERLIDIHSWNHNNEWAGFANSLHIYLDLLPYVDKTWIGEGFSENNPADFWLVEMSGIPFGMMSETLDAHNVMRGMTFGMLPRLPWSGNPVPMWKLWDSFDMKTAQFMGYWDSRNPLKCVSDQVKASLFVHPENGKTLVVLSNWSDAEQSADFVINGRDASGIIKEYPQIDQLQSGDEVEMLKPRSGAIFIMNTNDLYK